MNPGQIRTDIASDFGPNCLQWLFADYKSLYYQGKSYCGLYKNLMVIKTHTHNSVYHQQEMIFSYRLFKKFNKLAFCLSFHRQKLKHNRAISFLQFFA